MTGVFVTNSAADYFAEWRGTNIDHFVTLYLRKGRAWLRKAGYETASDDVALLAFHVYSGVSDLFHQGKLDEDYLVAGDVLDQYVTDDEAELLCELLPLDPEPPVGDMSPHVTAVHSLLLDVAAAMRETWETEDD